MSSPLIPGRTYDVTFDPDATEDADELNDRVYEEASDGFYIFREAAPDPTEDPGGVTLSEEGVAGAEGERVFLAKGWIRKIREHRGEPVPVPVLAEPPAPAEAAGDDDPGDLPDAPEPPP